MNYKKMKLFEKFLKFIFDYKNVQFEKLFVVNSTQLYKRVLMISL